jgi:hypothetical protein
MSRIVGIIIPWDYEGAICSGFVVVELMISSLWQVLRSADPSGGPSYCCTYAAGAMAPVKLP